MPVNVPAPLSILSRFDFYTVKINGKLELKLLSILSRFDFYIYLAVSISYIVPLSILSRFDFYRVFIAL